MIDALFTLATYTAIALSLLGLTVVLGAMVLEALHWGEGTGYDDLNEYRPFDWQQPVDESEWRDWDWPIPDDVDGWDFPEKDAA